MCSGPLTPHMCTYLNAGPAAGQPDRPGSSDGGGACVAAAAAAAVVAHLRKACRASTRAGKVWPLSSHLTLPSAVALKRPGGWASSSACTSSGSGMLHAM